MSAPRREHVDVAIVGGGVIGCAVAYALAREGRSVRLFERETLAGEASGAAAGMIAPLAEEHLRPLPNAHPHSHLHSHSQAGEPAAPKIAGDGLFGAALATLRELPRICEELREQTGIDPQWQRSGLLRVALDEAEAEKLRREGTELAAHARVGWLGRAEVRDLEPALAPRIEGGLWSPDEGNVRSPELTRAYAEGARALGARISEAAPVVGVVCEGDRVTGLRTADGVVGASEVVLCSGAWSGLPGAGLELPLGPEWPEGLPIEPVRGQILSLRMPATDGPAASAASGAVLGPRPIVWGPGAYIVPKRDGSRVVGATVERVGFDRSTTAEGIAQLLEAAPRLVPRLAGARLLSTWAGLRPGSPDGLPLVGRVSGLRGLVLAVGHHRNGVLLSWTTAGWVAALVAGKPLPREAEACRPERFATPRPISGSEPER